MKGALKAILLTVLMAVAADGHGRLLDPPARSSMWRFDWPTPANYDDNQMFCGGKQHQIGQGGKCGICGDPYDQAVPRMTEIGGPYYKGLLVANYTQGEEIDVKVQLTANHLGFFQFKICPVPGMDTEATQECLDKNLLTLAGTSLTNYQVKAAYRMVTVRLQLPADVSCRHCVLQWRYHTGNSWGRCGDGSGAVGCGPQEEFYGCADVAIQASSHTSATASRPAETTRTPSTTTTTTTTTRTTTTRRPRTSSRRPSTTTRRRPASTTTRVDDGWTCEGVRPWDTLPGIADWCRTMCFAKPSSFCPATHCRCYNEQSKAHWP